MGLDKLFNFLDKAEMVYNGYKREVTLYTNIYWMDDKETKDLLKYIASITVCAMINISAWIWIFEFENIIVGLIVSAIVGIISLIVVIKLIKKCMVRLKEYKNIIEKMNIMKSLLGIPAEDGRIVGIETMVYNNNEAECARITFDANGFQCTTDWFPIRTYGLDKGTIIEETDTYKLYNSNYNMIGKNCRVHRNEDKSMISIMQDGSKIFIV